MALAKTLTATGTSALNSGSFNLAGLGNCLVIALIGSTASAVSDVAVSDSNGNNYQKLCDKSIGANGYLGLWVCPNPVLGTMSASATWAGGATLTIFFLTFSGRSNTPVDVVASGTDSGTSHNISVLNPSAPSATFDAVAMATQTASTTPTTYTQGSGAVLLSAASAAFIVQEIDGNSQARIQNSFTSVASVAMADFVVILAPAGYIGRAATGLTCLGR